MAGLEFSIFDWRRGIPETDSDEVEMEDLTGEEPRRRTQPGIAPWTEKPGKGFNRRKQSKQRQKGFFTEVRKGNKEWLTTDGADFTDGFTFLHRGRMDRIMLDRIISLIKEGRAARSGVLALTKI